MSEQYTNTSLRGSALFRDWDHYDSYAPVGSAAPAIEEARERAEEAQAQAEDRYSGLGDELQGAGILLDVVQLEADVIFLGDIVGDPIGWISFGVWGTSDFLLGNSRIAPMPNGPRGWNATNTNINLVH